MSYLKIYEQERIIDKLTADEVDINAYEYNPDTMLICKPQCVLFDKDWNRVEEVYEFLEQRKNSKRQAWNTIEAKAKDIYGAESDWETLEISIPRSKTKDFENQLLSILYQLFDRFPVLKTFFNQLV